MHNISVCSKFMEYGDIDFFMMSVNPSIDYVLNEGKFELKSSGLNFYKECEKSKIGISVMRHYGDGKLLNEDLSSLNIKLTEYQCLQYEM